MKLTQNYKHAPTITDWLNDNGYYKKDNSWFTINGFRRKWRDLVKIYEESI